MALVIYEFTYNNTYIYKNTIISAGFSCLNVGTSTDGISKNGSWENFVMFKEIN